MELKPLILNRERNLGDIISDAFIFVKRNFKVIGSLFLIMVLPILILGLYNMYFLFKDINFIDPDPSNPLGNFSGWKVAFGYGFLMLAFMIYYYINYATAVCYVRNDNHTPEQAEVMDFMKENALKYITYFLGVIALFVVVMGVIFSSALISPVITALLCFALFFFVFYLFPVLTILPLLYIDQDLGFSDAIRASFSLVKGQWWNTFGTIFITSLIGSMASYILIIPLYAIMMVQAFSNSDASADSMGFWTAIIMMVSMVTSILVLIYTIAGVSMKYYDLLERKGHNSLKSRIDSIGAEEDSFFDNEGDF